MFNAELFKWRARCPVDAVARCGLWYFVVACATCAVQGGTAVGEAAGDWNSYNNSLAGWRLNPAESTLTPSTVPQLVAQWRFPTADFPHTVGVIHATPAVVDGEVYFGTATYPAFYKLSSSGEVIWTFKLEYDNWQPASGGQSTRLAPSSGVYSSALVTRDCVYFGDAMGKCYALDRVTGKPRWIIDSRDEAFPGAHEANVFLASPILANGKLILAGGAYEHAAVLQPGYKCCRGRGTVLALRPSDGQLIWKYDVGPEPERFDPPLRITVSGVERTYHYGPSTSSVWSTPSYDAASGSIFFGTDVHNSPRRPTDDDPRQHTPHSAAVIGLNVKDGTQRWLRQLAEGDVWNHTLPTYDPATGKYKDQSVGDTPKIYQIEVDGKSTTVLGVGVKNGGYYVLRADNGNVLTETPRYTGPPVDDPEVRAGTLALPSAIGGIQTGCATDGQRVFVNGIDALKHFPTGGRVTCISLDGRREFWRHERRRVARVPKRDGGHFENVGDPVASGIAVAGGVVYFTTLVSNQLVALDADTGKLLNEIPLGPVFCGPAVSDGRVLVGSGNSLFSPSKSEDFFPKRYTGTLYCFGLDP